MFFSDLQWHNFYLFLQDTQYQCLSVYQYQYFQIKLYRCLTNIGEFGVKLSDLILPMLECWHK